MLRRRVAPDGACLLNEAPCYKRNAPTALKFAIGRFLLHEPEGFHKFQIPSFNTQRITNHQPPIRSRVPLALELDYWSFFGCWRLGFGA